MQLLTLTLSLIKTKPITEGRRKEIIKKKKNQEDFKENLFVNSLLYQAQLHVKLSNIIVLHLFSNQLLNVYYLPCSISGAKNNNQEITLKFTFQWRNTDKMNTVLYIASVLFFRFLKLNFYKIKRYLRFSIITIQAYCLQTRQQLHIITQEKWDLQKV